QFGIRVANVFHAGDGNLHPLVMFDGREEGALHKAEELSGEIIRLCIRLGGSITGEHGVGLEKKMYLGEMYGEDDIEFMHQLARAIDPLELSNRGKKLPSAVPPALLTRGAHPLETAGVIFRD
ncbi:MAG: FAD-binding oxidoreductase, partial [Rhodopirellula sp.]|nr:FAD-binding oxidoreductase [Rhodopirellula sp.]